MSQRYKLKNINYKERFLILFINIVQTIIPLNTVKGVAKKGSDKMICKGKKKVNQLEKVVT